MKKINSDEPDYNYLSRRLMAAVGRADVRRVKAILALGADPNHPCVGGPYWSPYGVVWTPLDSSTDYFAVAFPLARVVTAAKIGNQHAILELLLAAGVCLSKCFWWLSFDAPMQELRFDQGLALCELIYASPNRSLYDGIIKTWLGQTSAQINQWPEPQYSEFDCTREIHLALHKRLIAVCKLYECQHVPEKWATAVLL